MLEIKEAVFDGIKKCVKNRDFSLEATLAIDIGIFGYDFEELIYELSESIGFSWQDFFVDFEKNVFYDFSETNILVPFASKDSLSKQYKNKKLLTVGKLIEIITKIKNA